MEIVVKEKLVKKTLLAVNDFNSSKSGILVLGRAANSNSKRFWNETSTGDNKPSQAEGDRETVEEDLGDKNLEQEQSFKSERSSTNLAEDKPSQAEGDRETIEADLKEK